jgi:hypothetical protein
MEPKRGDNVVFKSGTGTSSSATTSSRRQSLIELGRKLKKAPAE